MSFSATTYALSKKYTKDTAEEFGAVKGANCQIKSIVKANNRNTVTFLWKNSQDVEQESVMIVEDGTPIYEWHSGDSYEYGDLCIYASCFYRCTTPNHDVEFDSDKWSEIGSADGNYDIVQNSTLLPPIFTAADRKMYYSIEDECFWLWNGSAWVKQRTLSQYSTMPTAGASYVGRIVQYIGATNVNYTEGYYYKCTVTGEVGSEVYSWEQINIQPSDVVNVVEDGNMNPVTSNAVYDEAQEIKLSISNLSASVLHTSGNETATGVKTFSSGINSSKGVIGPKASGESDLHVPLELRGSDTEAWLLFSSRLGSGLGYFGTKSDNKPYFYNTQEQRLVMASEVGTASKKNSTNAVTQGSTDLVESGAVYAAIQQGGGGADLTILAPEFNTTTAYGVGDYVIYDGSLYRFTSAHSVGAWNNSQVVEIKAVGQYVTAGKLSGSILGSNATAEGVGTTASGQCSHAEGSYGIASGYCSHAEGGSNAINIHTIASGQGAHAEGLHTRARGSYSHAEGGSNSANDNDDTYATTASGTFSHAEGEITHAEGEASHSAGCLTTAVGDYSHAGGWGTIANGTAQYVIGTYNIGSQTGDQELLIVGNGINGHRSNALTLARSGNLWIAGTYSNGNSDYAEKFETLEECPIRHFVTLDGEKIRLAQPEDNYILGVVSENPSILGDVNIEGVPVGMLGKLWVMHDGTAKVNEYVTCGYDGIATADVHGMGYRVMSVDGNMCRILFR